jgi:hypothetical protein
MAGYLGRFTYDKGDEIEFPFWLTFNGKTGNVSLGRSKPATGRDERSISCVAKLPKALFMTPELRATITVAAPEAGTEFKIDTQAAAEALRGALGVDVDIVVNTP